MNPDQPVSVPREYRLDPGDLITLIGPPEVVTGPNQVTAEVHDVLIDNGGVAYRVRVLSSVRPALPVGSFQDVPHKYAQQLGLQATTFAGLLGDPRVVKYLSAEDRGMLAQVSPTLAQQHASIPGTMVVSPEVFEQIKRNRELGEPPLRPEKGERGQVTWMVVSGNPAVGRSVEKKPTKLDVRTFAGVSKDRLPVISTAELDRRVQLAQRMRYATLLDEAADFVARNAKMIQSSKAPRPGQQPPYIAADEAEAIAREVGRFAADHAELLAAPAENVPIDELRVANEKILAVLRSALGEARPANQFIRFITNEQAVQAIMWRMLGRYAASLPEQAAIVDFTDSALSQKHTNEYRNGQYLIVASRRFMYVLKAEGEGEFV